MNAIVSDTIAAVGSLLALWCFVWGLFHRAPNTVQNNASLGLEVVLVAQAVVALIALAVDRVPSDIALFIGYLATSVLVQPVLLIAVPSDNPRGKSYILGLALLSASVVLLRMQTTWDVR